MLLHKGALTQRKLKRGLQVAHDTKRRLGDVLVDLGYASEQMVTQCLAEQYGFDFVDLEAVKRKPERPASEAPRET